VTIVYYRGQSWYSVYVCILKIVRMNICKDRYIVELSIFHTYTEVARVAYFSCALGVPNNTETFFQNHCLSFSADFSRFLIGQYYRCCLLKKHVS